MIFLFILMQYFFQNIAPNMVPAVLLCAEALVVLAAEVEPACEKSQIPQGPTVEWSSGVIILWDPELLVWMAPLFSSNTGPAMTL